MPLTLPLFGFSAVIIWSKLLPVIVPQHLSCRSKERTPNIGGCLGGLGYHLEYFPNHLVVDTEEGRHNIKLLMKRNQTCNPIPYRIVTRVTVVRLKCQFDVFMKPCDVSCAFLWNTLFAIFLTKFFYTHHLMWNFAKGIPHIPTYVLISWPHRSHKRQTIVMKSSKLLKLKEGDLAAHLV